MGLYYTCMSLICPYPPLDATLGLVGSKKSDGTSGDCRIPRRLTWIQPCVLPGKKSHLIDAALLDVEYHRQGVVEESSVEEGTPHGRCMSLCSLPQRLCGRKKKEIDLDHGGCDSL